MNIQHIRQQINNIINNKSVKYLNIDNNKYYKYKPLCNLLYDHCLYTCGTTLNYNYECPKIKRFIEMDNRLKIYQQDVIKEILDKEDDTLHGINGLLLNMKMGLGKTFISLFLSNFKSSPSPNLVVCSKTNLINWELQIQQFYPNLPVLFLHPSYLKEEMKELGFKSFKQLIKYLGENPIIVYQYKIIITTYDTLSNNFDEGTRCILCSKNSVKLTLSKNEIEGHKNNIKTYNAEKSHTFIKKHKDVKIIEYIKNKTLESEFPNIFFNIMWDRVIIDESQNARNNSTKLYKSLVAIYAKNYLCLTGTPFMNSIKDVYFQLKLMGLDITFEKFRIQYNIIEHSFQIISGKNIRDKIIEVDTNIVNVEKIEKLHIVKFNDKDREIYNNIALKLKKTYTNYTNSPETLMRKNSVSLLLVYFNYLRQICNTVHGINKNDSISDVWEKHKDYIQSDESMLSSKLTKIIELCNIHANEKIVIFSSFIEPLRIIQKHIEKSVLITGLTQQEKRIEYINKFNDDNSIRILMMNYKIGSESLNLQSASVVILMEPWWNRSTETQSIARVWRSGQKKNVTVHRVITEPSFENYVFEIQHNKEKEYKKFFNKTTSSIMNIIENIAKIQYYSLSN